MQETSLINGNGHSHELADDEAITRFANYVNAGINSWSQAGKLLVEMEAKDPLIEQKITSHFAEISREIIAVFRKIGNKQVYPYLLIDNSPGSRALQRFPYNQQVKLYGEKINVLFRDGRTEFKRIQAMDFDEVERVFGYSTVRTIDEQKAFVESKKVRNRPKSKPQIAATGPAVPFEIIDALATMLEVVKNMVKDPPTFIVNKIKTAKAVLEKYEPK